MAAKKKPRVFICIDNGMIWEAWSDIPIELIIENTDKQWIRHLDTIVAPSRINEKSDLLHELEEENIKLPGLAEEEVRHIKISKLPKKKK